MRNRKYRPEISRNRMLSNWVLAKSVSRPVRRVFNVDLQTLSVLLLAVLGLTVLIAGLTGQEFAAETSTASIEKWSGKERREHRPTNTSSNCSLESFSRIATLSSFSGSTATELDGYLLDAKQTFGGLVAIDYRCNSPQNKGVFRVHLHLLENSWVVKKISRLPVK